MNSRSASSLSLRFDFRNCPSPGRLIDKTKNAGKSSRGNGRVKREIDSESDRSPSSGAYLYSLRRNPARVDCRASKTVSYCRE